MKVLAVDSDYTYNRLNEPVVRLFGKCVDGEYANENVVIHILGFEPYIYIGDCGLNIFELQKKIESEFKQYVKRVEIVKKYKPIGYQNEKTNMLKIVLYNPKVVRELRQMLKESIEELTDEQTYEADIKFRDRCMIDLGIDGMKVIEFDEKGKKIDNYGLNCNFVYVCDKKDIRIVDDNVMIEY